MDKSRILIMKNLLSSDDGRIKIAKFIVEPLIVLRDYLCIGREALSSVDEKIELVISDTGLVMEVEQSIPSVNFEASVHISEINSEFDVPSRIRESAKKEIFNRENKLVVDLISESGMLRSEIVPSKFWDEQKMAGDHFHRVVDNLKPDVILVSPHDKDKFNFNFFMKEEVKELNERGIIGYISGVTVYVMDAVKKGNILFSNKNSGILKDYEKLTVSYCDDCWTITQKTGFGVNRDGVKLLIISD